MRVRRFQLAASGFAFVLALALAPCVAQEIKLGGDLPSGPARKQHVEFESGNAHVKAGTPEWVVLRFQVDPGFHINSHTPHDELLMPTAVSMEAGPTKVIAERYPAGIPLHLAIGEGETLSTYQGEFRVELQVVAPKGASTLNGTLRYQACDAHACFPPRSLPVQATITAE